MRLSSLSCYIYIQTVIAESAGVPAAEEGSQTFGD